MSPFFLKLLPLTLKQLKAPVFDPESAGRRRAKHLVSFSSWRKSMALRTGFLPCGIVTAPSLPVSLTSVIHGFLVIIVSSHLVQRITPSSLPCWISCLPLSPQVRYQFVRALFLVMRCLGLFRVWQWLQSLPTVVDVVCLQETHCTSLSECQSWFSSSDYSAAVSPGSNKSCGCVILYRRTLTLSNSWCDCDGRFLQC